MTFRTDHEFILLGKPGSIFTKNYFFEWDDGMGGDPSMLFLNFTCNQAGIPAEMISDQVFKLMQNYFFVGLEREPADRFEDMLKEVNHYIQDQEKELGMSLLKAFHAIPAAITRGALYLSQCGQAEAYLVRRRFVSVLSEGLSDPAGGESLFENIASGALAEGDVLVFSSGRLLRYVSKSDLGRWVTEERSLPQALQAISRAASLDLDDAMNLLGVAVKAAPVEASAGVDGSESVVETESVESFAEGKGTTVLKFKELGTRMKFHLGRLIPQKKVVSTNESELQMEEKLASAPTARAYSPEPSSEPMAADPVRRDRFGALKSRWGEIFSEWRSMKRDKILLALVGIVIVLLGGTYLVRQQGQKQQYLDDLEDKLTQVETNIRTAQTTGSYDKESAKELLDEAEVWALEVLNSGYLRGKANEYLAEIETQRDSLDKVTRIDVPTVFVDFTLTNPAMNALGLIGMGDNLYAYEYDQLYPIILDEVQTPVTIDDTEVVIDAAYNEESDSLLFLTKANRLIEYVDGQFSFVDTDDGAWHSAVDLAVYNNRLYLLDPEQGQIWRYSASREGYGTAEGYVTDGTVLTDAVSLAIDGVIYVLNADGELVRFSGGEKDELTISKPPLSDYVGPTKIYTEFEMFQVFVLDPATSRVVIYNKDQKTGNLVYSAQYVFENVGELRDLYVDKESSRFYVLDATKIYEVSY